MVYLRYGIPRALRSLRTNWRAAGNNALILAASLAVLGMIVLLYLNIVHFSRDWLANTTLSLFLAPDTAVERREALLQRVQMHPLVQRATLVTPKQAMTELSQRLDTDLELLAGDSREVLPYTIDVGLFYDHRDRIGEVARQFKALEGVDDVVYSERLLDQVALFFRAVKGIGLFFIGLLVLSFYLVVSQATRLSLHARREEIEILSLVGATRPFIRSAFVVEGTLISLASAVLAVVIVWFCDQLLFAGLSFDAFTRTIQARAVFLPLEQLGLGLLAAMVLGGLSSHIAVTRLLRELEP